LTDVWQDGGFEMDQLSFPPHVMSDECPSCRKFAYRTALCTRCSDGRLHVLRDFTDDAPEFYSRSTTAVPTKPLSG
jgi:hypothetical protein